MYHHFTLQSDRNGSLDIYDGTTTDSAKLFFKSMDKTDYTHDRYLERVKSGLVCIEDSAEIDLFFSVRLVVIRYKDTYII